ARLPVGEECADHAVAHLPLAHALAHRDDLAGAVRKRDQVFLLLHGAVAAFDGQYVAIVERGGLERHQHLALAGLDLRHIDDPEIVETHRVDQGCLHGLTSSGRNATAIPELLFNKLTGWSSLAAAFVPGE